MQPDHHLKTLCATLCVALLTGCLSVGPTYHAPQLDLPDIAVAGWPPADNERAAADTLAAWWHTFGDAMLVDLITRALTDSPDIHAAIARVQAARAQLGVSRADFLPQIDTAADFSRIKLGPEAGGAGYSNMYRAGFDASWEIDIFGGTRRSVEAASAALDANIADLHDVWRILAAEVALSYIDIRTFQRRLQVARKNLRAQEDTLEILSSRYRAGLTDALDVAQARYNVESTRATIPRLQTGLENAQNALAVLLGRQPGSLHERFAQPQPIPLPRTDTALQVEADAIRRRPDIRRAERRLAAETARIGVAVADLYPRFSLAGFFGTQAIHSDGLFTAGAGTHSILPGVVWPVFNAGELRNRVRLQQAVTEQFLAAYEKTVLTAIAEVRDALTGYVQESQRIDALRAAVAAARDAVIIARDKYTQGLTDFNNVLDAQRSLLALEESLALSRGDTSGYMVRIYKALGGGWAPLASAPEIAAGN